VKINIALAGLLKHHIYIDSLDLENNPGWKITGDGLSIRLTSRVLAGEKTI
jgi:hypothetical protein